MALHVAFVDDGINDGLFNFNILYDLEISHDYKKFCERKDYDRFEINHGTTCAAITSKYYPSLICSSLKVLTHYSRKGNIQSICTALKWCMQHKVDIVNISLGSTDYHDEYRIRNLVNKLSQSVIIVAALSNRHFYTYPASFSSVLGVIHNNLMHNRADITYNSCLDGANIAVNW